MNLRPPSVIPADRAGTAGRDVPLRQDRRPLKPAGRDLTDAQLRRLGEAVPPQAVAGDRYDPRGMANLER